MPALDGLRGIAIGLVLIYHFAWSFPEDLAVLRGIKRSLWMGWVGVDLFFALSGFLITHGLLLRAELPFGAALKRFWVRRALRIFPLYYAMLAAGSLLMALSGRPAPGAWYWIYAQNYLLAFVPFTETPWTAHLWSLAVEEQFYLLWPPLLLWAAARWRAPLLLVLLLAGLLVRALAAFVFSPFDYDETVRLVYQSLPTRADGLLLGALAALALAGAPQTRWIEYWRTLRPLVVWCSSLALLALVAWTQGFDQYDRRVQQLGYPLLGLCFASVVFAAAEGALPARVARLLCARPLRELGKVSYAAYLLHWPLVVWLRGPLEALYPTLSLPWRVAVALAVIPLGFAVTWALSALCYRYFEAPLLRLKDRLS